MGVWWWGRCRRVGGVRGGGVEVECVEVVVVVVVVVVVGVDVKTLLQAEVSDGLMVACEGAK